MRLTDKGKLGRKEGGRDRKGKQESAGEGHWFILSTAYQQRTTRPSRIQRQDQI